MTVVNRETLAATSTTKSRSPGVAGPLHLRMENLFQLRHHPHDVLARQADPLSFGYEKASSLILLGGPMTQPTDAGARLT